MLASTQYLSNIVYSLTTVGNYFLPLFSQLGWPISLLTRLISQQQSLLWDVHKG